MLTYFLQQNRVGQQLQHTSLPDAFWWFQGIWNWPRAWIIRPRELHRGEDSPRAPSVVSFRSLEEMICTSVLCFPFVHTIGNYLDIFSALNVEISISDGFY